MNKTRDVTTSILGLSETRTNTISRTHRWPFFLSKVSEKAKRATATIVAEYLLSEALDTIERRPGRVGVLLVALLIPGFVVYGFYRKVINRGSLRQLAKRSGNERGRDEKRARKLVQACAVVVLVLSLACTATLVYFGEWPQAWDFLEIAGSFLDLLA